jgi:hypothetical protein
VLKPKKSSLLFELIAPEGEQTVLTKAVSALSSQSTSYGKVRAKRAHAPLGVNDHGDDNGVPPP